MSDRSSLGVIRNVVARFIQAGSISDDNLKGYLNSLQRIVKGGGHFVSPAQAKFLWSALSDSDLRAPVATKWGQPYTHGNPNAYAISLFIKDDRFGKQDPSKIRYFSFLFVIDGAGVKAMAKGVVHHPKGSGDTAYLESAGPTQFVRESDEPILYDHAGVLRAIDQKVRENAGLINKIKSVPRYEDDDFLQSILSQLESGRTLSPAQINVLNRKLPQSESVSLGDPTEWMQTFERGVKAVEQNLIHPAVEFLKQHRGELSDPTLADWYVKELTDPWSRFKVKPYSTPEVNGGMGQIGTVADWVGIKSYPGVTGIGDALATLYLVAKKSLKGVALPKTLVRAIPVATKSVETYERLSPSKVTQALEKKFEEWRVPAEDPFAVFDKP